MIELGWGLLGGFIAAAVEEVGRGVVRSAVGRQGGGAASAASGVHAVGRGGVDRGAVEPKGVEAR
jgi:hypothetical protein